MNKLLDPNMRVHLISSLPNPQITAWTAAHRCYSEGSSIFENPPGMMPETEKDAGERLIGMVLNPSHFGVFEHDKLVFEVVGVPHNAIMQARTHRVGVSFDVQSQRYTGKRVIQLVEDFKKLDIADQRFC